MSDNKSDYKKPRTELNKFLPEVYRSEVSRSLFENVFDRYLTKDETKSVFGIVGANNGQQDPDPHIQEKSAHRQGFQLQPLLHTTVATVDHISSYEDLLREAELLGIDSTRLPLWGNALQFNFAPPVNFDKLVNYSDYYWYDPTPGSIPQYITIENACNTATARLRQKQTELLDFGGELDLYQTDPIQNEFIILGNYTYVLFSGIQFLVYGSVTLDGIWTVTSSRFDNGKTYVTVAEIFTVNESGTISFSNLIEALQDDVNCACSNSIGWDKYGWDDNNCSILVGDRGVVCSGTWDTTNQAGINGYPPANNSVLWDSAANCGNSDNSWSKENHWIHKIDITPEEASVAMKATMPIIEYSSSIELNEWTYTDYKWMYRRSYLYDWEDSSTEPTVEEMSRLTLAFITEQSITQNFTLDMSFGNKTSSFPIGSTFYVEGSGINDGAWTVSSTSYTGTVGIDLATRIYVVETITTDTTGHIVPVSQSSKGHDWKGFMQHWALVSVENPVPVNQQQLASTIYFHQEQVPALSLGQTTFNFVNPTDTIALFGHDDIRVYVDGVRELGTYVEIANGEYVGGIEFYTAKIANTVIVVEVGPASQMDKGREVVLVRTELLDSVFNIAPLDPPVSLIRYRKVEQSKNTYEHKFPLFDIYNVDGTSAYRSSPIFTYLTSPSAPINPLVLMRTVIDSTGKEFSFEQHLIDEDNGRLYCYKDFSSYDIDNPAGLQTIWRKGTFNEEYVPSYVDAYRRVDGETYIDAQGVTQVANVPYGTGSWEIPNQLYYNASHENRKVVTSTQLTKHLKTIIESQELPFGFYGNQIYAYRLLDEPNIGLGGTIKEFNDSYDLFLSTMYTNSSNPLSVIVFANDQYDNAINIVATEFNRNLVEYLLNISSSFISNLPNEIANAIMFLYETNDAYSNLYGDTSAYDAVTDVGVRNWISTIPMFRLGKKTVPVILADAKRGINEVLHHDGHISTIQVVNSVINSAVNTVINTKISSTRYRGWTNIRMADGGVLTTRSTVDSTRLLPNDYWLEPTGKTYRLTIISKSATNPANTNPIGTMYLRTGDQMLMVRDSFGWSTVNGTPGDMTEAWIELDIPALLAATIAEIETNLYEVCPDTSTLAFDYTSLTLTPADQATHNQYLQEAFNQYTRTRHIEDPFAPDFVQTAPFTWNYSSVNVNDTYVNFPNVESDGVWGARWHSINENVFGTPYPHLEPWKLQGYTDKPIWWDGTYKDITTTRRWNATMWTNITDGVVPVGNLLPSGIMSTGGIGEIDTAHRYSFFSVNTSSLTTTDGYGPDDLLPPYWVPPTASAADMAVSLMSFIRSNTSIPYANIDDGYVFGDIGPVEWMWRKSSQFVYDELKIAFRMQPVRFLHSAWGVEFIEVGGLQINKATGKVYSHRDAEFHGDLGADGIFVATGINQWYVNFNRFGNYDSKMSDFYQIWREWDATLAYQYDAMIDVRSLELTTTAYNFASSDYEVLLKRTPGFKDFWLDSLKLTVAAAGRFARKGGHKIPINGAEDWDFVVDAPVPISRNVEYYGVQSCKFDILNTITGLCKLTDQSLPWGTGDVITVYSAGAYPRPLNPNVELFVYRVDNQHFKLAESYQNATLKNSAGQSSPITISFSDFLGTDELFVENNVRKYNVTGSSKTWRERAVRLDTINTTTLPTTIKGMQNVLDFIDGYSARLLDLEDGSGFAFNQGEEAEVDAETGQIISWQTEKEKMITAVYTGQTDTVGSKNSGYAYNYTVTPIQDEFTLTTKDSMWNIGQEIFFSTNGTLPSPLIAITSYFVIPVSEKKFKVASSYNNALNFAAIDITTPGTGVQYVGEFTTAGYIPAKTIEINPFRNNLWVQSSEGILANVVKGPYQEIRVEQTIYDQYGRPFSPVNINVFRQDNLSHISVRTGLENDVENDSISANSNLHIGGMHAFIDGFEHVILFNHYTTEGFLVYDAFVGLNTPCMAMEFARQEDKTRRPNIGGYFLNTEHNITRNIEASVVDMQEYYDTYKVKETANYIEHARAMLGYESPDYFDHINLGRKSKFLFWKSMIQHKGSITSINAFINSAHFIDAKVDEFWAYKLGEFGDAREQSFPEMRMKLEDVSKSDLRLNFGTNVPQDDTNKYKEILFADDTRWVNLPDILRAVGNIPTLHFDSEVTAIDTVSTTGYYVLSKVCNAVIVLDSLGTVIPASPVTWEQLNSGLVYVYGGPYTLYLINPAKSKLNPSKIIDTKTSTVLYEVPVWDPARGHHTPQAASIITLYRDEDPVTGYASTNFGWADDRVGTVWLDTSKLGYVPYFDNFIFPDLSDNLRYWGQLADWADVKMYEWTKSPVPPSEWAGYVESTQGDATLDPSEKGSGIVRQTLFNSIDIGVTWTLVPNNQIHFDSYKKAALIVPVGFGTAKLYVNGLLVDYSATTLQLAIDALPANAHVHLTNEFVLDDENYKLDTDYIQVTRYSENNVDIEYDYYFWVEDKSVRSTNRALSLRDATTQFKNFTSPFQLFVGYDAVNNYYTKMIVRNVQSIIDADNRYVYRFTRDFSLRDTLEDNKSPVSLKNIHSQWRMFREQQPYNVPQYLWDKATEALVGYNLEALLVGNYIPVPSLDRVLYDAANDTVTQYGLTTGQAFCNKSSGINTVYAVISATDFDPSPVNKTVFLTNYTFDTPENIKDAMDYIYNNFPFSNVNEIYFALLHDALATKKEYEGILKTSMIALHGIRVLETVGNSNGNTCQ